MKNFIACMVMLSGLLLAQGPSSNLLNAGSGVGPYIISPGASNFSADTYTQSVFSSGNSYDIFGCLNSGDNVCLRAIMQSNSASVLTTAFSAYNAYTGTGTNALVIGMEGFPQNVSSGTVTDMPAIAAQSGNAASGTGAITRAEGMYIYPCTNNGGAGTIATCIGLYVLPQTAGTSANYAILTTGGTNSFGDNTNVLQQTAATSGSNPSSPTFSLIDNVWNGSSSIQDILSLQAVPLANGANPAMVYNWTHSGSSGALFFQYPAGLVEQWATINTGAVGSSSNYPGTINGGVFLAYQATPAGASGQLGLGTSSGFGNGAAGTAVTTTLKSTGTGPATPQTIVNYLKITLGGTVYWVPLTQ